MQILIYAAIIAAIYAAGGASGWELRRWYDAETVSALKIEIANRNTADAKRDADRATADAEAVKNAAGKLAGRVKTNEELADERRKFIETLSDDAACHVPGELVRLHDTAAQAVPLSRAAGPPNAAAKPAPCRPVILATARNYDTCHDTADRLTDLQDWIKDIRFSHERSLPRTTPR